MSNMDQPDWKAIAIKHAANEARAIQYAETMTTVALVMFAAVGVLLLVIWGT